MTRSNGKPAPQWASPVTDHALIRWLQRQVGIDTDHMRARVMAELGPDAQQVIARGEHADIPMADGGTAVIRNGAVVTILGPGEYPTPTAEEYRRRHGSTRTDQRRCA